MIIITALCVLVFFFFLWPYKIMTLLVEGKAKSSASMAGNYSR